ncbi:Dbl homology domain-containing protein [Rickenella mellea]|uniref:Dbl homology domain-containing protein n=1 Tax=Rickenella mellea TaxID=50990 RepID=A0A4Y7QJC4_9AGAM|nr:Dbl homology domain-containing protein [Rickenella mellea]
MKALFNRLNRGLSKEKGGYSTTDIPAATNKEKLPELPPLPDWPPPQRATSTPGSVHSVKPLPDLSVRLLPQIDAGPPSIALSNSQSSSTSNKTQEAQPVLTEPVEDTRAGLGLSAAARATSPRQEPDSAGRTSRKATNGTVASSSDPKNEKKVAFISPSPTPAPMVASSSAGNPTPNSDALRTTSVPLKTTVSRFQATHGGEGRGSTATASSSKPTTSQKNATAKVTSTSTRTAISPNSQRTFADNASINQSLRSGTPYSQNSQSTSRILATASWSEAAEEDLVSNIGPRERTRQEVLWEIVASEERYVAELLKLKETFIEPLLHPFATSPISSPTLVEHDVDSYNYRIDSPPESLDYLPIAARFLSPLGFRSDTPASPGAPPSTKDGTPIIDGESLETDEDEAQDHLGKSFNENVNGHMTQRKQGVSASAAAAAAKFTHPRSPYNTTAARSSAARGNKAAVPFPTRSHQSLPPPPRAQPLAASTPSLRQSYIHNDHETDRHYIAPDPTPTDRKVTTTSRVLRKFKRSTTAADMVIPGAVPPHQLPEDLRKCLEVLETGIFNGHVTLSEGLRKRYDDQYPLVRSLADVFVTNSHILHEYATYVLHLERALEQVDDALSTASEAKRPKKQDAAEWMKVCKFLQKLEETAAEKGETGLAISLSKPFQRLLKYPLLFQNLLYHTDPSTFEYEHTLQMVAEVETIVRSIEDEKIQKEERDKTRDAFARIEGIEKVKQLALPKASRLLVDERMLPGANPSAILVSKPSSPPSAAQKNVKGKTSFRRLSDVLQPGSSTGGVGGKKDLWLVVFNDVVLRCQRTGVTSLPLASTTNSRTNSMPELQAKAKFATTGRRGNHTKPRNLYKFIKIETWAIGDVVQPRQGVVSMEDVARSRAQVHSGVPSTTPPPGDDGDDDEDGNESDESDRKSKMSFSYWGADKVTIHKPPAIKGRPGSGLRKGATTPSSYARESSANAKFGTRLLTHEPTHNRPASRRTQATPTSRRTGQSEDSHTVARSTVTTTRPAWDGSTRATPTITTTPMPPKRVRNLSQNGGVAPKVSSKSLASPAPSEDSGVGLYRQLMAQDSTLNRD